MKTLLFVRHAESVANAGGVTMPHSSIPLSNLGQIQARELAVLLDVEPSTVLVSDMTRTHQTAAPFCERFSILPQACSSLDEFSVIDPALIEGLNGQQRKPFVQDYWSDPDPRRRLGANADTFAEFVARVSTFNDQIDELPDSTVIFGHGIWFGMLLWRLLGYSADSADNMKSFRRFQLALPMPNCAVFSLAHIGCKRWSVKANVDLASRVAAKSALSSH
jgi:alpha-ribazole phosphatase